MKHYYVSITHSNLTILVPHYTFIATRYLLILDTHVFSNYYLKLTQEIKYIYNYISKVYHFYSAGFVVEVARLSNNFKY